MAKVWQPSDNGFINSKGEIGIWVDAPDTPPSFSTPKRPSAPPTSSYNPFGDYMSYLERIRAEEKAERQAQLERERIERERIRDERLKAVDTAYGLGMENVNKSYAGNTEKLNTNTASALQQAYISKMMSQKALPQQMQAMGISGGATESSVANMQNQYMNNRTGIEKINTEKLSDLEQSKSSQLAALEQARAAEIAAANAEMSAGNISATRDFSNTALAAGRDYSQSMQDVYAKMLSQVSKPKTVSTSNTASSTYADDIKKRILNGENAQDIYNDYRNQGATKTQLDEWFSYISG